MLQDPINKNVFYRDESVRRDCARVLFFDAAHRFNMSIVRLAKEWGLPEPQLERTPDPTTKD